MTVSVKLSPIGNSQQFFDAKGIVLAGGKLSTYLAGTTTPSATYSDNTGVPQNNTTLTLDSSGRFSGSIWLQTGVTYKFVLTDANNVVLETYDNVIGINDVQQGTTIPTGSVMLFQQPNAPPGWTRISTFDDAAIRVVGNAVPSSGGSNGFSSRMIPQISVNSHALTTAEMPTHTHDMAFNVGNGGNTSQISAYAGSSVTDYPITLSTVGSGAGHVHTLTFGLKYVDIILCSKN